MTLYNPYDDPEVTARVAQWRKAACPPGMVEEQPVDRGPGTSCWCTDYHLEVGLNLAYCPRHGRAPDPTLT